MDIGDFRQRVEGLLIESGRADDLETFMLAAKIADEALLYASCFAHRVTGEAIERKRVKVC